MSKVLAFLSTTRGKVVVVCMSAFCALMAGPGSAMAVETATEEKVKTVAEKVGSEGTNIVLIILAALVALLVAIIIIPKAIGLIKRFI